MSFSLLCNYKKMLFFVVFEEWIDKFLFHRLTTKKKEDSISIFFNLFSFGLEN